MFQLSLMSRLRAGRIGAAFGTSPQRTMRSSRWPRLLWDFASEGGREGGRERERRGRREIDRCRVCVYIYMYTHMHMYFVYVRRERGRKTKRGRARLLGKRGSEGV